MGQGLNQNSATLEVECARPCDFQILQGLPDSLTWIRSYRSAEGLRRTTPEIDILQLYTEDRLS